jgi:hypothetical protein
MSWLGDVFKFENFNLNNQWDKLQKNPERAFIGAMDEGSTKVWNKAFDVTAPYTGINRHYEPMTDYFGGASPDSYTKAQAAGINTGPARSMHNVAKAVVAAYAGGYGADALGAGGGAATGGTEAINPATGVGWSETGSGLAGNGGATTAGGSSSGFGLNPAMGSGVTSTGYGTTTGSSFGSLNPAMGNGVTSTGYGTTTGGEFGLNAASPSGIEGTQSAAGLGDLSASGNSTNGSMFNRQMLSQALKGMGGGQNQQQPLIEIIKEQPAFLKQDPALPIQDAGYPSDNPYILFGDDSNKKLANALRNS